MITNFRRNEIKPGNFLETEYNISNDLIVTLRNEHFKQYSLNFDHYLENVDRVLISFTKTVSEIR